MAGNTYASPAGRINEIKGEYVPEGMISADKEIGLMLTDVHLKLFC